MEIETAIERVDFYKQLVLLPFQEGPQFVCPVRPACDRARRVHRINELRKVVLTTGSEVVLEDEDALEHLFNAIVGEVISQVRESDEFAEQGFQFVYDRCRAELYYVAGQLKQLRSDIDISFLVDEFDVQWDRIAAKISNDGIIGPPPPRRARRDRRQAPT